MTPGFDVVRQAAEGVSMGVDEGIVLLQNEMTRTLALLSTADLQVRN